MHHVHYKLYRPKYFLFLGFVNGEGFTISVVSHIFSLPFFSERLSIGDHTQ